MIKNLRIPNEEIKPLVNNLDSCLCTDRITVDGQPIGFMYREIPDDGEDSGWRFLSGTETQAYIDDPTNSGLYEVNTIANYDTAIIPYLDAPFGAEFERVAGTDEFRPI
jgi:hypothetical protein